MTTPFPKHGTDWATLRDRMRRMSDNDVDWRGGRCPMHIYYAGEDVLTVAQEAYSLFMTTNALSPAAFPSLAEMEIAVIEASADLLRAPPSAKGNVTSGGTESIILAVKAARDWSSANGRGLNAPTIIVPHSAHPAFEKAAHFLGVRVIRTAAGSGFETDASDIAKQIDDQTIMIIGSAPCLPYGLIDPIDALSRVALEHDVWLHVDACIGGFLAPFVRDLGYPVPDFDFSVPGVRSMSADLHKYGYSAKGASVILYRSDELHRYQSSVFSDWPKGTYYTPTLLGTKSGGAIASAWATIHYLGESGYSDIAGRIMATRQRLIDGIESIGDLSIVGNPQLGIFAYTSYASDMMAIGDELQAKGWYVSRISNPPGIHQMINIAHEPIVERYLSDLASSVRGLTGKMPTARSAEVMTY
jgi:sphinganine-1-phosphate aldolase